VGSCCHNKEDDLQSTVKNHRKVLWAVLWINLIMFGFELSMGLVAESLSLVSDSLDMLGDAVTYASSILVVGASFAKKAKVARLKASIMLIFALLVFAEGVYKFVHPSVPSFDIMLGVSIIALAANLICLYLLTSHKDDDINMRSVWICSRNDIVANSSVIGAGVLVYLTDSAIPDMIVGACLAVLFTHSAIGIFRESKMNSCS
jgi:Co/Zn/Cd efflux system component